MDDAMKAHEDYSKLSDDEIIEMLIREDMLPAVVNFDGSILADEADNILLW